jgi:NAD(P)-dependent dehydrogenase (short-subunit alcohol dehydrogenase family)
MKQSAAKVKETVRMDRTYVVTGAASGIGAATARYLRERGGRVITSDLRDADVIGDLATSAGRSAMVDGATRLCGGNIDAILAVAGGGPAETSLSLNFFGAVATLEDLRPLLKASAAPRALAVSSIASLSPGDPKLIEACLSMDESAAIAAAKDAIAAGKTALDLYQNAKHALNRWCRRVASKPQWAGAEIPLKCGCARLYRHSCCSTHPFRSRPESDHGTDGTDARRVSRSS